MRGEYTEIEINVLPDTELPPRTRRIPQDCEFQGAWVGTTSAHAENTTLAMWVPCGTWNYLRARGEYLYHTDGCITIVELPPRTRRIPPTPKARIARTGTTSAHAENTCRLGQSLSLWGNYLRARGEYSPGRVTMVSDAELPPRTRRIQPRLRRPVRRARTTSAHAENTCGGFACFL